MTNMTKVVCVLALVAGCTEVATSRAQQSVTSGATIVHAIQQGRDANFTAVDGTTIFDVDAFETGNGANTGAFMTYALIVPDPASPTVSDIEFGFGPIAASDLSISADVSSATLHTTTGAGFTIQSCTDDVSPGGVFTCTDVSGTPRAFDLVWTANRLGSFAFDGTSRSSAGGLSYTTTGTNEGKSADVNGTAFGRSITGVAGASISDSRNTMVSRTLSRDVP